MKLLKILTIVLFSLSLSLTVLIAQDNGTADAGVKSQQLNGDSGTASDIESEKPVSADPKSIISKEIIDSAVKVKPAVSENKIENLKSSSKKTVEKKIVQVPVEIKEESPNQIEADSDLLLIDEGNFKYKRIPDIKLVEIKPEVLDSGNQTAEIPVTPQVTSSGFLGLSKTAADIIVKGGILLLLLLIFVIYKARMSGPGNKSSKKRNVLNSYRK